jgi:hypothetical protein
MVIDLALVSVSPETLRCADAASAESLPRGAQRMLCAQIDHVERGIV